MPLAAGDTDTDTDTHTQSDDVCSIQTQQEKETNKKTCQLLIKNKISASNKQLFETVVVQFFWHVPKKKKQFCTQEKGVEG